MALLQNFRTRPGARPASAPHRRRHRPRHHAFAGGRRCVTAWPNACPTTRAACCCPRWCATSTRTAPPDRFRRGRRARARPANTITSVKRLMGRGLADIDRTAKRCPTPSAVATAAWCRCTPRRATSRRSRVSAEILATLRYRAEDTFDDELYGAVITVPAYFDEGQRQADEGRGATGRPQRAAADQRAHGGRHRLRPRQRERGRLRGLRPGRRHLRHLHPAAHARRVRGHRDRRRLGAGRRRLRPCAGRFRAGAKRRPDRERNRQGRRARGGARRQGSADRCRHRVLRRRRGRPAARFALHARSQFDAATTGAAQRTMAAVRKALRDAGLKADDLQGIVLVGGSTRMPQIREAVRRVLRPRAAGQPRTPTRSSRSAPRSRPTSWPATTARASCCCST